MLYQIIYLFITPIFNWILILTYEKYLYIFFFNFLKSKIVGFKNRGSCYNDKNIFKVIIIIKNNNSTKLGLILEYIQKNELHPS